MPILGDSGRLVLKREPGDPVTVTPDDLNRNTNSFMLPGGQELWTGDKVVLTSDTGLPFYDTNGVATHQRGAAVWCNTTWEQVEGWKGIGSTDSVWCRPATPNPPWAPCSAPSTPVEVYIHVDQFGRVSFYPDHISAVNGDPALRLPLAAVDFDELLITSIEEPWKCMCLIRSWALELDAPAVDVTGLNTKFGENVKSLVTAGGEIDFMVELTADSRIDNSLTLMRLLLMTERGSKAQAQFWTSTGRTAGMCQGDCGELLPGDIYYEADVLVVGQALNLVPTEVVGGSVRFVSTGTIALKISDSRTMT